MPPPPRVRVNLWSGPRNVSTALMYAFAQRPDTRVIDEPLYGHYLRLSGVRHPGDGEILATMDTDGERVVQEVILGACDRPLLFIKNMAHHLIGLDWSFLDKVENVVLVRDPREMLPSLINQIPEPTLDDTALRHQFEIVEHLRRRGRHPPVLDAREVLLDPPGVLARLCRSLGLAFDDAMLRWEAGPRPEDGIWAPHWYHAVHTSTGFLPYRPKATAFPERLAPLLDACTPYYERLYALAIKATTPAAEAQTRET